MTSFQRRWKGKNPKFYVEFMGGFMASSNYYRNQISIAKNELSKVKSKIRKVNSLISNAKSFDIYVELDGQKVSNCIDAVMNGFPFNKGNSPTIVSEISNYKEKYPVSDSNISSLVDSLESETKSLEKKKDELEINIQSLTNSLYEAIRREQEEEERRRQQALKSLLGS